MLTPEQIERRRQGLGSSDMPRVVGVSPHGGPLDVYLDKLGLAEDGAGAEAWVGERAEAFIASLYEERRGVEYDMWTPGTSQHREHTFALATPDRLTWAPVEGRETMIVEIKLVGAGMLHLWRSGAQLADGHWTGLPAHVEIQVQWQLEVCDVERADVAALLGGTDFRIYPVERDRAKGAELLERGKRFWTEHVLARVPPPLHAEDERRMLALRYPMNLGDMLAASDEAIMLREELIEIHAEQRRLAHERTRLENMAKGLTTNADGVDGCWTWKRPSGAAVWRNAVRALFIENWKGLAARMGENEVKWEAVARALGAQRLIDPKGAGRRFKLMKTKEERDGEGIDGDELGRDG